MDRNRPDEPQTLVSDSRRRQAENSGSSEMTRETPREITRREFTTLAIGGLAFSSLQRNPLLFAQAVAPGNAHSAADAAAPLEIAEWSYFWVGVEPAELARGTVVNGKQMYVEYMIPAQVRHPYPIVLVHGGGGQGTDWMGTPDGRPGWSTYLLREGYAVYVIDRQGHGRPPFHPELEGAFPEHAAALENISGRFTPPNPSSINKPLPFQHFHNQWPGKGDVGSPDLDQFVASQGGSYVAVPVAPGAPASAAMMAAQPIAHEVWRERGAMVLDKIGPAVIMTHSAGGPFGWLVAESRPDLVKGIIAIEGGGQPFGGANIWGMSTIPVAYDPPVSHPSEIETVTMPSPEKGVQPYKIQAEPARKLKNLQGIPIVIVTSQGSFASPGNPGAIAYFKQAGCNAEELRLVDHGIFGNGHMMMVEKNNREVLQPILDWMRKNVERNQAPAMARTAESAVKLSDQGFFWVGTEHKKMPYGTILAGQMFVQYLIPAEVRHPYPVILVHGGTAQMLHYMGNGGGEAGWAHYYLQAGHKIYLVDRPGHGRAPYHPDALGPIGQQPVYEMILPEITRSHRWPGSGQMGDPLLDQLMASQDAAPLNDGMAHQLWASRGAELLDKTGPAIVQVHSAAGPFGWLAANERPQLVKGIVNVEGFGFPFGPGAAWGLTDIPLAYDPPVTDPSQFKLRDVAANGDTPAFKLQAPGSARQLKNLRGVPILLVTAGSSGRTQGPAMAAFLKQAGCNPENFRLNDHGISGNGHFMMLETNRKQVFEAIESWVASKNVNV